MKSIRTLNLNKAILNWQNAVGATHNGELEAFLGMTLGDVAVYSNFSHTDVSDEVAARVEKLLSENHVLMIKAWMARNE